MKTSVLPFQEPGYYVARSSLLSSMQVMDAIAVVDVIKALNTERINFVLAGAHGMARWRQEARATEDVDVIVMARHQKKAVRALAAAFPDLEVDELEVVTRLRDRVTKSVRIDVMKSNQPLFRAAFEHAEVVKIDTQKCKLPTLEMALAMKFAPMVSLLREDHKKYMDAADFIRIVKVNSAIDLDTLSELGDLVYPGGGKEIVEKVRQVRAGEKLSL